MFKSSFSIVLTTSLFVTIPGAMAGTQLSESETASLQAAMQSHIEQQSVAGALLDVDEKTGKIRQLYPTKAHPKILTVGHFYYMCSDFRDSSGKSHMVNFYAAKDGDRYVIFYTDFNDNEELEDLIEEHGEIASN